MEARLFSSPVQTPNILMSLLYFSPIMHTTVLKIPGVVNSHMNQTLHHHRCKLSTHAAPCFSFIFFFGSRRSSKRWAGGTRRSRKRKRGDASELREGASPAVRPSTHAATPHHRFAAFPPSLASSPTGRSSRHRQVTAPHPTPPRVQAPSGGGRLACLPRPLTPRASVTVSLLSLLSHPPPCDLVVLLNRDDPPCPAL
jgi:hypothetical protein